MSGSSSWIPERLLVTPVGFLRGLLTVACLSIPLIWLRQTFFWKNLTLVLAGDIGLGLLNLVWIFQIVGRFGDAGRYSNFLWFPYCVVSALVYPFPGRSRFLSRYEALALFLLLQVPLAFMRSKPRLAQSVSPKSAGQRYRERRLRDGAEDFRVRPVAFLIGIAVISSLFALLIYMRASSDDVAILWCARFGYAILCVVWIMILTGRFTDAGLSADWYPFQYCLVVCTITLMPVAFHWVNLHEAVGLFALIQTPVALLPSKSQPQVGDPL